MDVARSTHIHWIALDTGRSPCDMDGSPCWVERAAATKTEL